MRYSFNFYDSLSIRNDILILNPFPTLCGVIIFKMLVFSTQSLGHSRQFVLPLRDIRSPFLNISWQFTKQRDESAIPKKGNVHNGLIQLIIDEIMIWKCLSAKQKADYFIIIYGEFSKSKEFGGHFQKTFQKWTNVR